MGELLEAGKNSAWLDVARCGYSRNEKGRGHTV